MGFSELMLDCQQVCAGCLSIQSTMGANVGPRTFMLGFRESGIMIYGGHEVMVHESWLGEYLYSSPLSHLSNLTATGITVAGNDHFVTNTIVFSSKIGVGVYGAANLLTGVHTWCVDCDWGACTLIDCSIVTGILPRPTTALAFLSPATRRALCRATWTTTAWC